jgi:hypothetical protein
MVIFCCGMEGAVIPERRSFIKDVEKRRGEFLRQHSTNTQTREGRKC